jgi:hypothetical protein
MKTIAATGPDSDQEPERLSFGEKFGAQQSVRLWSALADSSFGGAAAGLGRRARRRSLDCGGLSGAFGRCAAARLVARLFSASFGIASLSSHGRQDDNRRNDDFLHKKTDTRIKAIFQLENHTNLLPLGALNQGSF